MQILDAIRLSVSSVRSSRTRSGLTTLSIAIGVAAVVILTSIGEGMHRYMLGEFTQFGTHLVVVTPGKTSTFGISGAIINNVRPLSLDDADSLRQLRGVEAAVPFVQGNADIEHGRLTRRSMVFGVGAAVPEVWRMQPAIGQFLPEEDARHARPFAVIGKRLHQELFKGANPLGERLRIGGESFRVIGVMESKGQLLGFDLDDAVYLPVGRVMAMFNQNSLMEIDLLYSPQTDSSRLAQAIRQRLLERHGSEDFTITTQDQMLDTLGSVLSILTLAVAALGSLSLLVGAIGILTIMTIAVNERRAEIGLLAALGASPQSIMGLFLLEAVFLSAVGGVLGLLTGFGCVVLLEMLIPALPVQLAWPYVFAAQGVAAGIGLLSGLAPARAAAHINPVEALHEE